MLAVFHIESQEEPLSVIDRTKQATQALCAALGLNPKADDLKYLTLALAEVAAREAAQNPEFARTIATMFTHIAQAEKEGKRRNPKNTPKKKNPPAASKFPPSVFDLVKPLKPWDYNSFNPYKPEDPYELFDVFGNDQFIMIVRQCKKVLLRQMAAVVLARHPETRKPNLNNDEAMIAYILEHVPADMTNSTS